MGAVYEKIGATAIDAKFRFKSRAPLPPPRPRGSRDLHNAAVTLDLCTSHRWMPRQFNISVARNRTIRVYLGGHLCIAAPSDCHRCRFCNQAFELGFARAGNVELDASAIPVAEEFPLP